MSEFNQFLRAVWKLENHGKWSVYECVPQEGKSWYEVTAPGAAIYRFSTIKEARDWITKQV